MRIPLPFPVTMVGRIDECLLLSFRTPAERVERLVPRGLELVTLEARDERWAFWNVVLCHIEKMRPKGVPKILGVSYHHAAYRLMVRASTPGGRGGGGGGLEGLYFLRSDADSRVSCVLGDPLSDFRFHTTRVRRDSRAGTAAFVCGEPGSPGCARVAVVADSAQERAPASVFESVEAARRFLKYRPMGLCPDTRGRRVRLAEVFRDEAAWDERVVRVERAEFAYFGSIGVPEPELELATRVAPIDYRWRLGRSAAI